jgi:hypothetical protein
MNNCIVENISINNITFSASFQMLDPSPIEDCGFLWGNMNSTDLQKINLGQITEKNFTCTLKAKTDPDIQYVVKAWVRSGSKYFYSVPAYFHGALAVKPKLVSLNKEFALWGDTIVMKVEHLPGDATTADINVLIDGYQAQIIHCDSTQISVQMPFSYKAGAVEIKAFVNQQSFSNILKIENALPQINSVYPLSSAINGTLFIRGKFNTDFKNRILPVMNDQMPYTVKSYTENEISVSIPESASCSNYFNMYFMILMSASSGQHMMISTNYSIKHIGGWEQMSNINFGMTTKSVYLNGEAYVFEQNNSGGPSWFARFTPGTNQWTYLADFPMQSPLNHNSMICEGNIYAGFWPGYTSGSNFYRYDIPTNTWISLKSLSKRGWDKVVAFTNQNKIYAFVMGDESKLGIYDPANNTWSYQTIEVPELIDNCSVFNYNGKYYFYKGSYDRNYLYRFDESEGAFSSVKINDLDLMSSVFFEYAGKYYCMSYDSQIYELDMVQKKLSLVPGWCNYLLSGINGNVSCIFSNGSKMYFSLGQNVWYIFTPGVKQPGN